MQLVTARQEEPAPQEGPLKGVNPVLSLEPAMVHLCVFGTTPLHWRKIRDSQLPYL